jgi:uncharacterized protein (TIGR03000 family)
MYTIVLAMALAPGSAAPAADIEMDLRDLKRSVAQLREEQTDARVEELKLVIAGLRQQITDEKLDELRRDIRALRRVEEFVPGGAVAFPMPAVVTTANRATVAVEIPTGANFVVNDQQVLVPAVNPTFVTPPLEPGRDYFYDCKVTVNRDGKTVTKTKRVKVHAGEAVRINYEDMEAH